MASGAQPAVELHIEELVLHGFEPRDRYRIGEAVQHELTRLIAQMGAPGWLSRGGEVERLDGGAFETSPDSGAKTIGAQVARAVYTGLAR